MAENEVQRSEAEAGIDLRALELEIDREIDALFVPVAQRENGTGTEVKAPGTAESDPGPENVSAKEPGAVFDPDAVQSKIDAEIDRLFVPASAVDLSEGTVQPGGYHPDDLPRLIEMFNAAYLSLDWEFSRENIQRFIDALSRLEPFTAGSPYARSVLRIIDAILKRLVERPRAVNSTLVQLIRDSQGLLTHLLLMGGETGPQEKQALKNLIGRFQELRQRALAIKAGVKRQQTYVGRPEIAPLAPPDTMLRPGPSGESGLSPLPPSLQPHGASDLDATPYEKPHRVFQHRPASISPTPRKLEKIEPARELPPARHEDLYLIVLYGKCLALPASCVLRVARLPGRKRGKILKRGWASLADFRPPFRRLVTGLLGHWTKLSAKELKSYRFEPLSPLSADQPATQGPMAILASDGKNHRVIFCELVNFVANAKIEALPHPTEGAFGPFENKSHLAVPVFEAGSQPARPLGR